MVFNLAGPLADLGFTLADDQGLNTDAGAGLGGILGTGLDLIGRNQQVQATEDSFNQFARQTQVNTGLRLNQLSTRRLQERLQAAQQIEDLNLSANAALASSIQSALESGVSGNSVKALDNAKRLQVSRVRGRLIRRQEALDAELDTQSRATIRQAKQAMTNAALRLENSLPSSFQIYASAIGAGVDVFKNFGFGPINLDG